MTYQTQPGTLAHRVVEYLKAQPPGTELSTAAIAEAIDCDSSGFTASMATVVRDGIVRRRFTPHNRRVLLWSLGDGTPLDEYAADRVAGPEAIASVPVLADVKALQTDQPIEPKPAKAKPVDIDAGRRVKPFDEFLAALWTDGKLQIQHSGNVMLLTESEVDKLRQLLGVRP